MLRTLLCSLSGAGTGFFLGFILVTIIFRGTPASDAGVVILFFGSLLAVGGAIAGALIGAAADLLQYFRRRDQAQTQDDKERDLPDAI